MPMIYFDWCLWEAYLKLLFYSWWWPWNLSVFCFRQNYTYYKDLVNSLKNATVMIALVLQPLANYFKFQKASKTIQKLQKEDFFIHASNSLVNTFKWLVLKFVDSIAWMTDIPDTFDRFFTEIPFWSFRDINIGKYKKKT